MALSSNSTCKTSTTGVSKDTTRIYPLNYIINNGNISSWCAYLVFGSGSIDLKMKIFRDDGTNFVFVGETSFQTLSSDGLNSGLSADIDVLDGDFIGFYLSESPGGDRNVAVTNATGTMYYKNSDVITTTTKSSWGSFTSNQDISIAVIGSTQTNRYVDIATGSDSDDGESWANAYLTIKKGIDNIGTNGIINIAEGDYSAQAAIDLDKDLELLCEDYGGGNANPPLTVVLPVTT